MATATTTATPVASTKRMTLGSVKTGKQQRPQRIILQGIEGIGKSTFAADSEKPIFLCAEDGVSQLNVARFPEPSSYEEIVEALETLRTETHDYKTLVIDTIDWLEPLLWAKVCKDGGKPHIEAFGFGKGYDAALDLWRVLLAKLDHLRATRGMHIIMLAHASIRAFNNPDGDNFDRYELKLQKKAAGLLKEWSDCVLFASYETATVKEGSKSKGVSTGARVLHTTWRAAYDAKNRYGLPDEMPLSWEEFWTAAQTSQQNIEKAKEDVLALAAGSSVESKARGMLARAGDDPAKIAQVADWVRGKFQIGE
jgi:hypothetical protein